MRILNFMIVCCFLSVLGLLCGSCPAALTVPQIKTWEYKRIQVLGKDSKTVDFPLAAFNDPPGNSLRSMVSGKVVNDLFQQDELNIFEGRLIIQIDTNYDLYNEKHEFTYYMMVFDFNKAVSDGMSIAPGNILGQAGTDKAKALVFSKTLDPYLVVNSNSLPVFYAGYFWFSPSFLSASGNTRWLTFNTTENITNELKEMADHLVNEPPGLAVYEKRVRFKTELSQYPRGISDEERTAILIYENIAYGRSGIITHITEIKAGGYDYLLCWQNGFLEYLKRDYVLNTDVWLYGIIVTYDVWAKKGYVFMRDFTPESVEEIYEGRLEILKGS